MEPDLAIEPFAADTPELLAAARVYYMVWGEVDGLSYVDAVTNISRHSRYPAFRGLLARSGADGPVLGMVYGHTSRPGQWWHDRVAPTLPPEYADWLDDCLVVVELAVRGSYRRRGVGRALLREILRDRPEARAALSTERDNAAGRALYAAEGWQTLVASMRFAPGTPEYLILGCSLG
ncbi:MAG TPA: GNAT family N-acetyltransferase [Thermomicrobiaceae bacterium]|nr:GNAT family N-acetyltransferase [Thermomicrobiaceae bacterium]